MQNRFDWVVRGDATGPDPKSDIDLFHGQSVAVVPSLGSIYPGWLLAIPRQRLLSLRQLRTDERANLLRLCKGVGKQLSAFSSQVFYLEHGPAMEESQVGCGVDQAHLHLVPTEHQLLDDVLADDSVRWSEVDNADPWAVIPPKTEYYMISNLKKSYVGFPLEPRSQYFRKKLAALNGTPDEWDYRKWPHYEHIERTIDGFAIERIGQAA
jgi:ATP adenylyltransferase